MDYEKEYKRKALEPIVNYIESAMASYSKEELEERIKKALPEMESEDLEKEIKRVWNELVQPNFMDFYAFAGLAHHFVKWQKEQMLKEQMLKED